MANFIDMTGWVMKEHGVPDSRVTVIERGKTVINSNGKRNNYWKCKCDCGNEFESTGIHIRSGACKSCGCFQKEKAKERHTVHGGKYTRLYRVWAGMKGRCEKETNPAYYNYGGRGIRVCDDWHNFAVFREWAINNGYDETAQHGECTLDRINNNKNYEPSNCRWITMREQANNKRTNRFVEFQNETKTIAEWSKIIGISENLIMQRLNRGWTSNAALLTPINKLKTKRNITNEVLIEYCGKTMNMSDWSRELDIPYYLIRSRIRELGWSAEKAFTTTVKKKGECDV